MHAMEKQQLNGPNKHTANNNDNNTNEDDSDNNNAHKQMNVTQMKLKNEGGNLLYKFYGTYQHTHTLI